MYCTIDRGGKMLTRLKDDDVDADGRETALFDGEEISMVRFSIFRITNARD